MADSDSDNEIILLHAPEQAVRAGWDKASLKLNESGDDGLVWPEFANEGDADLQWPLR